MTASVFITGVSSGIGEGLVREYLNRGWEVFGISRRNPDESLSDGRFRFQPLDVAQAADYDAALAELFGERRELDLVVLNAGVLGRIGDLIDADLDELNQLMAVNVWGCKLILDWLYRNDFCLKQVVTISSGASVNGNRGWGGYSISKAALNMLTKLYARERPETHFTAFAPGLVDSAMQEYLCGLPEDKRYPSLEMLRSKRNTKEMPDGQEAAGRFASMFQELPHLVESGDYVDVRNLNHDR